MRRIAKSITVMAVTTLSVAGFATATSAQRRSGISASYPTIDKCVWDSSNPSSGLTPVIYSSSFQRTADDPTLAKRADKRAG